VLRLDLPAARNELLDVIVYAAASVLIIDKRS
jgi:phage terminase large subunit GpA-like protein